MGRTLPFERQDGLMAQLLKNLPNLFKLARVKKRNVHTELQNFNWIRSLASIDSPALLDEFILLFMTLESVVLSHQKDKIK
jgi:hypothetical protein